MEHIYLLPISLDGPEHHGRLSKRDLQQGIRVGGKLNSVVQTKHTYPNR